MSLKSKQKGEKRSRQGPNRMLLYGGIAVVLVVAVGVIFGPAALLAGTAFAAAILTRLAWSSMSYGY